MSLTADLALVTACRDALARDWMASWGEVASAALSLIEDTLNRHVWQERDGVRHWCNYCGRWQCVSREDAVTALHTIATALGVNN